ncbi:MAG: chemotaxis protein CheW [Romboutsia sp.]|uniref:chemotaxis protein CheW n=1 Tax=Paraclostridium sp. TaxID=2023273 RepID=UPI003A9FA420
MNANEEIIENKLDDLYMVFVINNQKYALSSKYIIEIIEMLPITKVPFLPKYMKGIINLRSTIIPVMDARMRFDMEPIEYNERTCIIIIENKLDKIGLIVDAVNEVIHICSDKSMKMNSSKDEDKQNFIEGVSEINNEIQLILDCDSLMEIVEDMNNEINE